MTESEMQTLMKQYAANAVLYAKENDGVILDYSEQSIVAVDQILAALTSGGLFKISELVPEQDENLWIICKLFGGYVGEVIARNMGATWKEKTLASGATTIELFVSNRITATPPQKVWKRLTESEHDTMLGYYRGLQHILGKPLFVPKLSG
jgi:hypothetical protein